MSVAPLHLARSPSLSESGLDTRESVTEVTQGVASGGFVAVCHAFPDLSDARADAPTHGRSALGGRLQLFDPSMISKDPKRGGCLVGGVEPDAPMDIPSRDNLGCLRVPAQPCQDPMRITGGFVEPRRSESAYGVAGEVLPQLLR